MADPAPLVSVIMPIRNEEQFIERSLGAVLAQDYPVGQLEVLVADGMSSDRTREVIDRLRTRHPAVPVQVIDNPGGIVATGFNRALARSHGEIIVRVDGHTEIDPDYVRTCVTLLARTGAANVGGPMRAVGGRPFQQAVALATSSPFGIGGSRFHYSDREEWTDTVYMGAWPKSTFDQFGGFDEELVRNQDDEFNYRVRGRGGRILLSPAIRSTYTSRGTLRSLFRQYYEYGSWKVRVLQKHPGQMRPDQFAPPVFVAALTALGLLAGVSSLARRLLALLLATYAAATATATAAAGARARPRAYLWLPIVYATLHTSYGLGFLRGLYRFRHRWGAARRPPAGHQDG